MGALLTANDCLKRVQFYIDETSPKNFSPDDLLTALNSGMLDVQQEMINLNVGFFEIPSDLNPLGNPPGTVPGVQEYALPTDFLSFKRVSDGVTDFPIDPKDLNQRYINPFLGAFAGLVNYINIRPVGYYVTGNAIGFIPMPQGNFPVHMVYVQRIPMLVLGTDVPGIPIEWRDLVCVSAAMDAMIKDDGDLAALERKYNRKLNLLTRSITVRQSQLPQEVTHTGQSW